VCYAMCVRGSLAYAGASRQLACCFLDKQPPFCPAVFLQLAQSVRLSRVRTEFDELNVENISSADTASCQLPNRTRASHDTIVHHLNRSSERCTSSSYHRSHPAADSVVPSSGQLSAYWLTFSPCRRQPHPRKCPTREPRRVSGFSCSCCVAACSIAFTRLALSLSSLGAACYLCSCHRRGGESVSRG